IAWGGHIASQVDWGIGKSASDINGSPYHSRVVTIDTGLVTQTSIGNQDRSLKASSVVLPPHCNITGPATPCGGSSLSYCATLSDEAGVTTSYTWSILSNLANACISASTPASGSVAAGVTAIPCITVVPCSAAGFTPNGSFTVHLVVTRTFTGTDFSNSC